MISADEIKRRAGDTVLEMRELRNPDTSALEREIDEIVYEIYGLTEEERRIVERELTPLSFGHPPFTEGGIKGGSR